MTSRPAAAGMAAAGLLLLATLAGCAVPAADPASPSGSADGSAAAGSSGSPLRAPTRAPDTAPTGPAIDVPVQASGLETLGDGTVVPPVSLTIAAVQIEVPIDPVGARPDGQMEIPPLAERAGWYRFDAAPGEASGTAVVAAHVDSVASAGLGPFARLQDVTEGDAVEVTLADGTVARYVVSSVERTAKPAISWPDVFVRDGDPRLVLVTCGGAFAPDAGSYSDNVIVTALPVPDT